MSTKIKARSPVKTTDEVVAAFFEVQEKKSHRQASCMKNVAHMFLRIAGKRIEDLDRFDLKDFLKAVDNMNLRRASKETYRNQTSMFLEFAYDELHVSNPPAMPHYSWTVSPEAAGKKVRSGKLFTDEEMREILEKARRLSMKDHCIFLLEKHCGARLMEILTIKVSDVDLENRRFSTGV